jgi:hypothetical protein
MRFKGGHKDGEITTVNITFSTKISIPEGWTKNVAPKERIVRMPALPYLMLQ